MPTELLHRLTRRTIWSACASITLLFLFSTSSQPSVPVPVAGFSLGLETVFPYRSGPHFAASGVAHVSTTAADQFRLIQEGDLRRKATDRYLDSVPFGREIRGAAQRYDVDSLLIASVVEAESSFRPDAVSDKGALGLMQLMPLHFEPSDEPLDPTVNLNLGARYLRDLRNRYGGDLELALAAYHAGPGTIDRFGGLPPYRETQAYVGRVMRLYNEHRRVTGAATATRTRFASGLVRPAGMAEVGGESGVTGGAIGAIGAMGSIGASRAIRLGS
ncbi:MAG: lytic transglycosylase domain-containing protein [Thermoanaerobaculia bacterium]